MNVAIIPARGGSSRVPQKNIKDFCGKPMIAYSIEAAKRSQAFQKIIVSTDSPEIAEISKKFGAEVPFMRPEELSHNHINVGDVVAHAVNWLQDHGTKVEYGCCIVATAPLLKAGFIAQGLQLLKMNPDLDSVVSVKKFPFPIWRAFKNENERLRFVWPEHEFTHSKDLPESYHDAAQFYWFNVAKFLKTKSLMGKEVAPVILPEYLVRDIDTLEDWESAEIAYQIAQKKGLL